MSKSEQAKLNNKCAISILENTKKLLARTTLAKSLVLIFQMKLLIGLLKIKILIIRRRIKKIKSLKKDGIRKKKSTS